MKNDFDFQDYVTRTRRHFLTSTASGIGTLALATMLGQENLLPVARDLGWRYDASSPGGLQCWPGKRGGCVGVAMLAGGRGPGVGRLRRAVAQLQHQRHREGCDHRQDRHGPAGSPSHPRPSPRYSPAKASRCSVSGPCTSSAASSGSVGPRP